MQARPMFRMFSSISGRGQPHRFAHGFRQGIQVDQDIEDRSFRRGGGHQGGDTRITGRVAVATLRHGQDMRQQFTCLLCGLEGNFSSTQRGRPNFISTDLFLFVAFFGQF